MKISSGLFFHVSSIKNGTSITTTGMQSELLVASSDGMFSLVNMNRGVVLKQVRINCHLISTQLN